MKNTISIKLRGVNYTIPPSKSAYAGLLIDTHFHIPQTTDAKPSQPELGRNITLAEIACTLKAEGTKTVFAFFPVYEDFAYDLFIREARRAETTYPNTSSRLSCHPLRMITHPRLVQPN